MITFSFQVKLSVLNEGLIAFALHNIHLNIIKRWRKFNPKNLESTLNADKPKKLLKLILKNTKNMTKMCFCIFPVI